MSRLRFHLASASPRRRTLLRELGLAPTVSPVDVDERVAPGEPPAEAARRLAELKGSHAVSTAGPGALVLAADTIVAIDGDCLGKPGSRREAAAMLGRLAGREHRVFTGVFLARTDDGRRLAEVESTTVRFRDYDETTIAAYVASGEADDKAGAYGIQGRGVLLVEEIRGSWSNVVGLPLERLPEWMASIGIDLWSLLDQSPSEPS